jgi:hypothetical protein
MLGCSLGGYNRLCAPVTGGVDRLLVGDAFDFDFTTAPLDADGNPTGYDNIALHAGALTVSGAWLFEIDSLVETIGVDITQANADGSSSSYEYVITARLAQMSQQMTNFNIKLDAAATCCQMVFIWRNNDGRIFVVGERNVDGDVITRFRFRQDGSVVHTGKLFTDFNGEDLSLKGSYLRLPYEYVGPWIDIETLVKT